MRRWLIRRVFTAIPTLLGITLVVFLAVHVAPGDPATLAGDSSLDNASEVDVAARAARFRADQLLDASLARQYAHWLGPFDLSPRGVAWAGGSGERTWHGLLVFDVGDEWSRPGVGVMGEIGRRLAISVPLGLAAALVVWFLAVPFGAWCALCDGTRRERFASAALFLVHSLPTFWFALLLVFVFGPLGFGWLPVVGMHDKDASTYGFLARAGDVALHAVLPIAALAMTSLAYLSRHVRGSLLTELRQDYVRAALARGLSERDVVRRHALPNALIPALTVFGTIVPMLLSGVVVVETIFGVEGLGKYAYEGLLRRDLPVILAVTTVSAILTLGGLILADFALARLDPRIRLGERRARE